MAQSDYLPTIGLEIHTELKTATKMFCNSKNDAAEIRPNTNVCPVCMAHPGVLPVINKAAVEHVLRVGAALGARLADYTEFDRKNYFYPDLPKGYQLSQFEYPLVSGGQLNGVKLTRIHLEEDTASSIHDEKTDSTLVDYNRAGVPLMELVTEPVLHSAEDAGNFGRELQLLLRYLGASEADMEKGQMRLEANISVAKVSGDSASSASSRYDLKNSDSKVGPLLASNVSGERYPSNPSLAMSSEGAMNKYIAADANASSQINSSAGDMTAASDATGPEVARENNSPDSNGTNGTNGEKGINRGSGLSENAQQIDLAKLGTKVEVKNINSFRAMERAIEFEVKRQVELLERGEKVVQETRGWDENKQATFSQRVKEGSADYRYFPDPDLPSLKLSEIGLTIDSVRKTLPMLPWERRGDYLSLGINTQDIELFVKDRLFGEFFDEAVKELNANAEYVKLASNYIANDLVKLIRDIEERDKKKLDEMPISKGNFAKLIRLVSSRLVSSRSAKEILALCLDGVSDPETVAKDKNLMQDSASSQIDSVVPKLVAENPDAVRDWKAGKEAAVQFLVGQGMKALRGAADPKILRDAILREMTK